MDEVKFRQKGQVGLITLDRPAALHALSLAMIVALQKQLSLWKEDKTIHAIVLEASPSKAFCAGGDVRWIYHLGRGKGLAEQRQFFWHEYRLNHFIHQLGKPYISLMDGLTMGGGVGISLHGSHPLASERFLFAMPETGIGFFPDIGASYLLTGCPGSLGMYLGLTGNTIGPEEAKQAGLVKDIIPSDQMQNLLSELIQMDLSKEAHAKVDLCIQAYAKPSPKEEKAVLDPLLEACFSKPRLSLIRESSEGRHLLEKKSPLSLSITWTFLQRAKGCSSLAECLNMDFNLVQHFLQGPDFYEGVRALLIDKDKNPHWKPEHWEEVSENLVASYFEKTEATLDL